MVRSFRFDLHQFETRDLPSAAAMPERVIVRYLETPASEPLAESITPLGFGYWGIDLKPGIDSALALRTFATRADVAEAMPDTIVSVERTTNDPLLSSQWALSKTLTFTGWNASVGTGRTVVAEIDTGVDTTHPDLVNNIWRNTREIAGNGRDDDGNGYIDDVTGYDFANNDNNPADDDGHGTHVAGIIAADGDNGIGVSGVNGNGKIMPLKFLKADGTGYTSDAVRALNYAVASGAKIVNLSWGGGSYNAAMVSAIAQARAAGVIIVAAAGNNGANSDTTPFYPASYSSATDNMVVVGASTTTDQVASYSNYGRNAVTIYAPGSSILSLRPGGGTVTMSGTSMAAPFISGALSLLWDYRPTLTYAQIIAKLRSSIDSLSAFTSSQTGGRINMAKLMDATSPPVVVPPVVPPPPVATSPVGTRTSYTSTVAAKTIADFATVTMPITIFSDVSITDIDVGVSLTHGYVGDLTLKLIGPDGTSVLLANRRGGSGDNYTSTLFSDQATGSVSTAAAPFSGSLKGDGSLSAFNGRSAKGTWTLSVTDNAYYDTGRLTAFTLHVTGVAMTTQKNSKQAFVERPMLGSVAPMKAATRSLLGYETYSV